VLFLFGFDNLANARSLNSKHLAGRRLQTDNSTSNTTTNTTITNSTTNTTTTNTTTTNTTTTNTTSTSLNPSNITIQLNCPNCTVPVPVCTNCTFPIPAGSNCSLSCPLAPQAPICAEVCEPLLPPVCTVVCPPNITTAPQCWEVCQEVTAHCPDTCITALWPVIIELDIFSGNNSTNSTGNSTGSSNSTSDEMQFIQKTVCPPGINCTESPMLLVNCTTVCESDIIQPPCQEICFTPQPRCTTVCPTPPVLPCTVCPVPAWALTNQVCLFGVSNGCANCINACKVGALSNNGTCTTDTCVSNCITTSCGIC